jgi:hypothetical protein
MLSVVFINWYFALYLVRKQSFLGQIPIESMDTEKVHFQAE